MKRFFTLLFIFGITATVSAQKDPVVMTIDGEKITKSEFLSVYLKNNNDPKFDKQSLDEYMELYKRFKLKVAEAKTLDYDKNPELIKELNGYRKQLARPYLVDSAKNEALIKEAFERSKFEIRASHILIRLDADANPVDTLRAYTKIMALRKRIEGGEDFGTVAASKTGSEDPSAAQNRGDLGYFTAFQMVYPFETAAYNTPVGKMSTPVRTKYGYHIIQVNDKRPARGTLSAAHIMIASPSDAEKSEAGIAEKKIYEIYEKLQNGEDFSNLVRMYSDDTGSKGKGGRLPEFGTGTNQRMVEEFEDAAFALTANEEYSKPFRTQYGFHIVKRIDFTPLGTYQEMYKGLQTKVNRGERGQKTQDSFIQKLKKQNKFKDKSKKTLNWFYAEIDTTIFEANWKRDHLKKPKTLFIYAGKKYNQNQFKAYLEANQRRQKATNSRNYVNESYQKWVNQVILEDEESKLESKYPEFKALMREYHDGVLLYEIMKDKVWDKAIKDTSGLQSFFQENQQKYSWTERANADIFIANDRANAVKAFELIETNPVRDSKEIAEEINSTSQLNVRLEFSKYPIESTPFLKHIQLKEGLNEVFEFDGKYYTVVVKEFLPIQPKSLAEARGSVIQDYQNHLEESWLVELRSKYLITVQSEVLYNLRP